jgi:gamma-glutamylcyclotransferase (GGCT)/AIG2-like uncharacterized protein YtfP
VKLFVYGTLKRGKHNNEILRQAKFLTQAFIRDGYNMYVKYLPYLIKEKGGMGVTGELFEIDEATLRMCDYLEGHPILYKRETVWVTNAETGEDVEALVYLYNSELPRGAELRREYV